MVLLFKLELLQTAKSSMLAHSTESTAGISDTNKWTKPNTFHETFYKTGIDPVGLSSVTPRANQETNIAITKLSPQRQIRSTFPNRRNSNTDISTEDKHYNMPTTAEENVIKVKSTMEIISRILAEIKVMSTTIIMEISEAETIDLHMEDSTM